MSLFDRMTNSVFVLPKDSRLRVEGALRLDVRLLGDAIDDRLYELLRTRGVSPECEPVLVPWPRSVFFVAHGQVTSFQGVDGHEVLQHIGDTIRRQLLDEGTDVDDDDGDDDGERDSHLDKALDAFDSDGLGASIDTASGQLQCNTRKIEEAAHVVKAAEASLFKGPERAQQRGMTLKLPQAVWAALAQVSGQHDTTVNDVISSILQGNKQLLAELQKRC